MDSRDFTSLKQQDPFHPFRVILMDGRFYDVVHRQLMLVHSKDLLIALPRKGSTEPIGEHLVWVPYPEIKQVEMLGADRALPTS